MRKQLGKAACAAEPFGQPGARFAYDARAIGQDVAEQEVAGEVEAGGDFFPGGTPAFANEARQGEKLSGKRLSLGRADGSAGFRADRDKVIVGARHRTAIEIQTESQLGEKKQLIAHQ